MYAYQGRNLGEFTGVNVCAKKHFVQGIIDYRRAILADTSLMGASFTPDTYGQAYRWTPNLIGHNFSFSKIAPPHVQGLTI
jgi:hypothetical protein